MHPRVSWQPHNSNLLRPRCYHLLLFSLPLLTLSSEHSPESIVAFAPEINSPTSVLYHFISHLLFALAPPPLLTPSLLFLLTSQLSQPAPPINQQSPMMSMAPSQSCVLYKFFLLGIPEKRHS